MSEPQGTVFGLRIASELPLPDLAAAEGDGPVDVTIRVGGCGSFSRSSSRLKPALLCAVR